jgi:hypothetical protein
MMTDNASFYELREAELPVIAAPSAGSMPRRSKE